MEEVKKRDEKVNMKEMHQHDVTQMVESADESAGLLHNISKYISCRRGAQILVNEEEDAGLLDRCEAKRKEWTKHWQCDEEVQNVEEKPRKNEALRRLEEELPRLKECHLEEASRLCKAKTRVGCDGFHPKVPWIQQKKQEEKSWIFLSTTMFFLIPENVTSERPIALMPTLIRWWEALRAPEVAKWQKKYRVEWDATDGRNGGAQQTVWEILMEMERFNGKAKEEDQGALALVSGLGEGI